MKILGTGLSGLVGTRLIELLSSEYNFEDLSLATGIDITNKEQVFQKIKDSNAPVVLHLAAKTYVDGCEEDKIFAKFGEAWKINVEGTRNIVDACSKASKKLIYFSTDFIFDGRNPPTGGYTEEDIPDPINWYATTKYEGEKIINRSNLNWTIIRLAYPYRANFVKKDFVRSLIQKLQAGENLKMVTDHVMTPTFIDDIALALDVLIKENALGIFHVVGSQFVTPYEAAIKIADFFNFDKSLISTTTRDIYFKGHAQRSFRLALKNDKIAKLGVKMKTFDEGLIELKKQII